MSVRHFGGSLDAVADARRWASSLVADQPDAVHDRVALVVSELCTNALLHAPGGFDLGIERTDAGLRVEVADVGTGMPTLRDTAHSEAHGRGLRIVDRLASDWGVVRRDGPGKTVWARMAMVSRAFPGSGEW